MSQIIFFALREDLLPVLEAVESQGALKYARMGNFRADEVEHGIEVFDRGEAIPDLGKADAESSIACESFLVCEWTRPIELRTFRGDEGEWRVCVDQLVNPHSVTFTPGGVWGEDVILQGRVGSASESRESAMLMRRFRAAIKKQFTKVRASHVGPNALLRFRDGARLTDSAQSPPEYDLSL